MTHIVVTIVMLFQVIVIRHPQPSMTIHSQLILVIFMCEK